MQDTVEKYSSYENSVMSITLKNLKKASELQVAIELANQTNNDKFALKLREDFCKFIDLVDGVLPPFSAGGAPNFYVYGISNIRSIYNILLYINAIEKNVQDRNVFYHELISQDFVSDISNLQSSQEFNQWFAASNVNQKREILNELLEKEELFKAVITKYQDEDIYLLEAILVLSMPNSIVFEKMLDWLIPNLEALKGEDGVKSLLSFYDHRANFPSFEYIVRKLSSKRQVEYSGDLSYVLDDEQVNLSDEYSELITKLKKLQYLYYSYYKPSETLEQSSNSESVTQNPEQSEEAENLDLTFPVVDDGFNFSGISSELEKHKKDCYRVLKEYKKEGVTKVLGENIRLLSEFQQQMTNPSTKVFDKNRLTYGAVKQFLKTYYKLEDDKLEGDKLEGDNPGLRVKYLHLKNLLLNSQSRDIWALSDSSMAFQEINSNTVLEVIGRLQTEYQEYLSKLARIVDEGQSEVINSDDSSVNLNLTIDSINLINQISRYLQSMQINSEAFGVQDFFAEGLDLYQNQENEILARVNALVTDDSYQPLSEMIGFLDYLRELPGLLNQQRKNLLCNRLNAIRQDINAHLNDTLQIVANIKQLVNSLSTIDDSGLFDGTLAEIKSKIAEVKTIQTKLLNLEIICNFNLPTEDYLNAKKGAHDLKVLNQRRENNIKKIHKVVKDCLKENSALKKYEFERVFNMQNQADSSDKLIKETLLIIEKALEENSNLDLRSGLYKLKADLLDADNQNSHDRISVDAMEEFLATSDCEHIKEIYSQLKELKIKDKSKLITYLYEFEKTEDKNFAYKKFKAKFEARLSSYDNEMFEQDKTWLERKKTILIAICTIGIALLISYGYTSFYTGKGYYFWEKTHKQEIASKVFECLDDEQKFTANAHSSVAPQF